MTFGVIGMDIKLGYIESLVKEVCKATSEQE